MAGRISPLSKLGKNHNGIPSHHSHETKGSAFGAGIARRGGMPHPGIRFLPGQIDNGTP